MGIRGPGKKADREIIEGISDGKKKSRGNSGHDFRNHDLSECLHGVAAKVEGRIIYVLIKLTELWKNVEYNDRHVERNMSKDKRSEAELEPDEYEKKHQRNADDYIRVHHRNIGYVQNKSLEFFAHGIYSDCRKGSENDGTDSRNESDYKGIPESGQNYVVGKKLFIPFESEFRKNGAALRFVERKNDEHRDGKIKKSVNDADIEFGKEFHTIILPSFSTLSESN